MVLSLLLSTSLAATAPAVWPQTRFEINGYQTTSTVADVDQFMTALMAREPTLRRYQPAGAPATTETGQPLNAWRLPATGKQPLRVYINAGIHAGEVEGKDAMQLVLREIAQGKHPAIREHIELVTLPTYNADGADAQNPLNRRHQPNPAGGVGPRENVFGIDLNRDMMKAQAANTRWQLAMYRDFQPAAVFDLHTTNGSYHGFHVTYEPSWATGADAALQGLNRSMLVELREQLKTQGMPTYDYGNFRFDENKDIVGWESAFSSPNLVSNYPTLQYSLGILVETYVYRQFKDRIEDNRRYVLAALEWLAKNKSRVLSEQQAAKQRWADVNAKGEVRLPLRTEMVEAERYTFDVVDPEKNAEGQIIAEKSRKQLTLPAFVAFKAVDEVAAPKGYLVDPAYAEKLRPVLEAHGLQLLPGSARPKDEALLYFHESERKIAKDTFQGVFTVQLKGEWKTELPARRTGYLWDEKTLANALYVPVDQPLGRSAFYLLDPRSGDGLVYWGYLHAHYARGGGMWGEPPRQPILAVGARAAGSTAVAANRDRERVQE